MFITSTNPHPPSVLDNSLQRLELVQCWLHADLNTKINIKHSSGMKGKNNKNRGHTYGRRRVIFWTRHVGSVGSPILGCGPVFQVFQIGPQPGHHLISPVHPYRDTIRHRASFVINVGHLDAGFLSPSSVVNVGRGRRRGRRMRQKPTGVLVVRGRFKD